MLERGRPRDSVYYLGNSFSDDFHMNLLSVKAKFTNTLLTYKQAPTHLLLCLYKETHINISKHFCWAINFFPLGKYSIDDNNEAMHILEISNIQMCSFGLV
jgi:hypothetical protein